jgi:hypothetical protein|tara:strand:+ start:641 stop:868 length:228 start_codon:yes stop_codon:yes gene_type:complete
MLFCGLIALHGALGDALNYQQQEDNRKLSLMRRMHRRLINYLAGNLRFRTSKNRAFITKIQAFFEVLSLALNSVV